jgi:RHS repeat-associated protein
MAAPIELCRYRYDALDRLATRTPLAQAVARRFYNKEVLASEIQGAAQRTFACHERQLLAYQSRAGKQASTALTATDLQNSVLSAIQAQQRTSITYAPYGHGQPVPALPGLPGFNGEQPDPVTAHYPLGNGYRAYSPVLMRFNSPDSLSPFGKGGLNAYGYCAGDPVNRSDPTGHEIQTRQLFSYIWMGLGLFGAVWGVKAALPALKTLNQGTGTLVQQLSAGSAVSQVIASSLFTASGVVNAVKPDKPDANFLLAFAVAIAVPTVPARIATHYAVKAAARATPIAPVYRPVSSYALASIVRAPQGRVSTDL